MFRNDKAAGKASKVSCSECSLCWPHTFSMRYHGERHYNKCLLEGIRVQVRASAGNWGTNPPDLGATQRIISASFSLPLLTGGDQAAPKDFVKSKCKALHGLSCRRERVLLWGTILWTQILSATLPRVLHLTAEAQCN